MAPEVLATSATPITSKTFSKGDCELVPETPPHFGNATNHDRASESLNPRFDKSSGGLPPLPTNRDVAAVLTEIGDLLETQGAIAFRVRAFREAARMIERMESPVASVLLANGADGLIALPTIGRTIAKVIAQLVHTGSVSMLQRLRGESLSERAFTTVAEIGPKLAQRIRETLGIETLFDLQAAAIDGRLSRVEGMGEKRVRAVRESLAGRFGNWQPLVKPREATEVEKSTTIAELLDVDDEYRRLARADKLAKIAPRRFNPGRKAWLPILHTERQGRHYTALFSNTVRAHQLNRTDDWVVIHRDDDEVDGQWTIITSQYGALRGRRIVRGREDECAQHYR